MTQPDIQARGGPSPAKVREIINGRSTTLSRSKRRDLERAIKWMPGSIETVLGGGDPLPLSDESDEFLTKLRHPRFAAGVYAGIEQGDQGLLAVLQELLETGQLPSNAHEQIERLRDDAVIEQFPKRFESLSRGRKLRVARYGYDLFLEQLDEATNSREEIRNDLEAASQPSASPEVNENEEAQRQPGVVKTEVESETKKSRWKLPTRLRDLEIDPDAPGLA